MDAIFDFDEIKDDSIELKGITSFRDHFTNRLTEDFNKDINLHLSKADEIKLVRSRLPVDNLIKKCTELFLDGSPFMIALVLGEFEIAEKILELYPCVSTYVLGKLNWRYFGSTLDNISPNLNTIEILLYGNSCTIPEKLRNRILQRIAEEAKDIYSFSLMKVNDIKQPRVRKLLMEDSQNFPELFLNENSLYARDIETLYFLLKVFQGEEQRKRLLINNNTGLMEKLYSDEKYDLKTDMKCIGNIVNMLIKCPNTYRNLYIYLLKIMSQIQTRMLEEDTDIELWKKCSEYQDIVWKIFDSLPFDEEDFKALREEHTFAFHTELLYELAVKKLGKKMPLYIDSIYDEELVSFFGLIYKEEARCEINSYNYIFGNNSSHKAGIRLMRILPFVSRIEYPADYNKGRDLEQTLKKLLSHNAEELKDSFPELLAKGLIPDECLDSVMNHVSHVKKCAYMRPLLIMQKFGGIIHDEI